MTHTIVVGVDGSEGAMRALRWCADHAAAFDAVAVVVHAVDLVPYYPYGDVALGGATPIPPIEAEEARRDTIARDWCAPLAAAGVEYRVEVVEGPPATVISDIAGRDGADLVVIGRTGHGALAELLLGSTGKHLASHLDRPLLIVP
jgi:nucleotide-binding universal stress UspA family protein